MKGWLKNCLYVLALVALTPLVFVLSFFVEDVLEDEKWLQ